MKSFTRKLILYCTGVVFISLLVVYFLFNAMVNSYIRTAAERELAGGMMDIVDLTYANATIMMGTSSAPVSSVRVFTHEYIPHTHEGRFQIEVRPWSATLVQEYNTPWVVPGDMLTNPRGIEWIRPRPGSDSLFMYEGLQNMTIERRIPLADDFTHEGMAHVAFFTPIRQQALIATDVIMLGAENQIISPRLEFLSYNQRAEVEFLANYYLSNRGQFDDDAMTMVTGAGGTFYLSAASQTIHDNTISILMYTDVSSTMAFVGSMNRMLGVLLVLSALLSLTISVIMSSRFKRAIVRLCNRAETIGHGNFNEMAGPFTDTEFNRLSKSMDNMSSMLQTYEDSQKKFFQNVSHELRTPLMSILGYAEGIAKDIFTKEEAADIILAEGQKMAGLVNELLYVSRIDNASANQVSAISNLDVKDLIYECVECVKPIAQQSGIQVVVSSPPQEITIAADADALERAIINILSNAIRHAESTVKINYHAVNGSLKILVEDDGSGINPSDLPHIFERLYKGENGNHGLGLAISKDIIKASGGSITAENKNAPGKGAVFTIALQL